MKIWIDADACPKPVKQVVFKTSGRLGVPVCLVANVVVPAPRSDLITSVRVDEGIDEADEYIAREASAEDIVITADIPLAALIVDKGAAAINPRGDVYTEDNVKERLATRDFMDQMRSIGFVGGGPAQFSAKNRQDFANALDRVLTKRLKRKP